MVTDPRFTPCRSIGHSWASSWTVERERVATWLVLRCSRCRTVRRDLVSRSGELVQRRYEHPDGYLWKRPADDANAAPPSRVEYRAEFVAELLRAARSNNVRPLRRRRAS